MSPILLELVASRSAAFTATVVIAGMGIVFLVLLLLIFVFKIFGKAVSGAEKKTRKSSESTVQQQVIAPSPAPTSIKRKEPNDMSIQAGISPEIVAAIAAAVAVQDGQGAVIRSVTRQVNVVNVGCRNPWAAAAIADNTRPF